MACDDVGATRATATARCLDRALSAAKICRTKANKLSLISPPEQVCEDGHIETLQKTRYVSESKEV